MMIQWAKIDEIPQKRQYQPQLLPEGNHAHPQSELYG